MFEIIPFEEQYTDAICALILNIQQNEFQVTITLADQPDLLKISAVYQQNGGNFWVAVTEGEVIGTIALIDCGEGIGCIRKMFVRADWRGKGRGLAQQLFDTLEAWAGQHRIAALYLGTVERLHAAIRFYIRNGFEPVVAEALPASFPRMAVDTHFFGKGLIQQRP
ncbi:MAG: GNAT family N-acetyltransferase [Phycisphaerae bacterium]|nr:GNAT family N-acetyltransferase [Saprospiraceae bacterium]